MIKNVTQFIEEDRIFGWIEGLCQFPHRRTGSPESRQALEYLRGQFEDIGLAHITVEEAESATYEIGEHSLCVAGEDIPCFPINGTFHPEEYGRFESGPDCLGAELIYLHEGREEDFQGVDVRGKIVLCDCPWFDMDEDEYAENWCSKEAFVYDPDKGKRQPLRKTDSYSPNTWPYNYIMAQKGGAAGFVGILNDYFRDGINWNEDYSEIAIAEGCEVFAIPGLWIGTDALIRLKPLLSENTDGQMSVHADLRLTLTYDKGKARNIYGVLPGKSEDTIIVHCHYDGLFRSAVQDASGMSEVLALAKYFSGLPLEKRPYTMLFAGLDGHYTDYAGHQLFVKNRLEEGRKIICDVVIEHIGKEVGLGENNEPIVRDEPEIRLLYVTDVEDRVGIVKDAVVRNDLRRTIVMPVEQKQPTKADEVYEFSQDEIISDGYYSDINGIPVISLLSPQMYLFHPMDTPEMIPKRELVPVGTTMAEIILELMARSAN